MKLGNFLLSIIAAGVTFAAVASSHHVLSTNPTTVISVPSTSTAKAKGGGMTVKLPARLTPKQASLLNMAYDIAKKDGHAAPQLLQGIILQETHAGELRSYKVAGQEFGLKPNARYYGVSQLKLGATQDVLARYPRMRDEFNLQTSADEEIIAKLIENDRFNLAVASKYLLILKSYGYDTVSQLALAYNQGPGGAKSHDSSSHHYPVGVMKYIQSLRQK